MRRMVLAVALCVSLLLVLSGCQSEEPEAQTTEESESVSLISQDEIAEIAENRVAKTYSGIKQPVAITGNATPIPVYSDDVAWIYRGENQDLTATDYTLIDLSGNMLFSLSDKSLTGAVTPYHEGAALASLRNDPYIPIPYAVLIDKSGNTIWSSEKEGIAEGERIYGKDALQDVSIRRSTPGMESFEAAWKGYTVIQFDVDSYEYTGRLFGIIDSKGEWVVEPPTIEEAATSLEEEEIDLGSHNESMSPVSYYPNYIDLYHQGIFVTSTGELFPYEPDLSKFNGFTVPATWGGMSKSEVATYADAAAHRNHWYEGRGLFVNEAGEVTLDISDMNLLLTGTYGAGNINAELAFADSDYCLVTLENSSGGQYATLIDMNGNQMFDPLPAKNVYEFNSIGFFYQPNEDEPGWYLDVHGNKLGSVTGYEGESFRCNRAWIQVGNFWECVNEKGEIAF